MSLIRNGYAVSDRRGFLGALFSVLLALALFDHGVATAQAGKQIKLTEKHIQSFMGAYNDMVKVYESADPDKPDDPKVEAQVEAIAKKNGFASLAEFDDVSVSISMVMSGIDPQTKKFTEPPEQIKKEIAALKAGNLGGNAQRSRHALNADTIREMHLAFRRGGRKAIEKVMRNQPAVFLKLLVLLVPREMKLEIRRGQGDDRRADR